MEVLSLQEAVKMLEEVVVGWREVRWIWQMRQKFVAQSVQLLKHWLCDVWSGTVMEKNWALSVEQCLLQVLQFSKHLINLLSTILRYNGFTGIQKVVVNQIISRPPNSDHDLFFFGANLALGSALELLASTTELVIAGCHIQTTFHYTSQSNWEMVLVVAQNKKRWHFKMTIILICGQLMRHPVIELFQLSNLFQMPYAHRTVSCWVLR